MNVSHLNLLMATLKKKQCEQPNKLNQGKMNWTYSGLCNCLTVCYILIWSVCGTTSNLIKISTKSLLILFLVILYHLTLVQQISFLLIFILVFLPQMSQVRFEPSSSILHGMCLSNQAYQGPHKGNIKKKFRYSIASPGVGTIIFKDMVNAKMSQSHWNFPLRPN